MSDYHLASPALVPSLAVKEAREKRRKVLEAAWQRRRENYLAFLKKRRLQAANTLATIA